MKKLILLFVLFPFFQSAFAQEMPVILSMEQRAAVRNRWLEERFSTVLPAIMEEQGIEVEMV